MPSTKNIKFLGLTVAFVNKLGTTRPVIRSHYEPLLSQAGNFLVCPLSMEVALAIAQAGAKGPTSKQISNALHIPHDPIRVQQAFLDLYPHFQVDQEYILNCMNKVYIKQGFDANENFKKASVDFFKAQVQNIDFLNKDQAVAEINKWVENKTQIKDFVSKDRVHENTRVVLVNAIYFQGRVSKMFHLTKGGHQRFFLNNVDYVETHMLESIDYFNYYENITLKTKTLELPFDGNDVSFTFVLPDKRDGLADLENHIPECFAPPNYTIQPVHVRIPRCIMRNAVRFNEVLQGLGVMDAFEDKADFTGILSKGDPLKLSTVMHKTFIEINDRPDVKPGTGIVETRSNPGSLFVKPVKFTADHPFIFYLKHRITGIFFMGRMYTIGGEVKSIKTTTEKK